MLDARTLGVSIARNWQALYAAIWAPETFAAWASGLSRANLRRDGDIWRADGADGPVAIRFTPRNEFGIMDHYVDPGTGREIYVPMRVIANGEGAEIVFTLFRQPDMSQATFDRDVEWVQRDLAALRDLALRHAAAEQ